MSVQPGTGTLTTSIAPGNTSPVTSANWTISGSGICLIVYIGLDVTSANSVTAVSWSLGGTGALVKALTANETRQEIWAIPNATAGTGTYSVTLSSSGTGFNHQISSDYFTGADTTTPCPTADAVATSGQDVTSLTATPSNVGASDAIAGAGSQTLAANPTGVTPTQTYLDPSLSVNMQTGYGTGSGSIVATWNGTSGGGGTERMVVVAVRIQAPAGGGDTLMGQACL